MKTNAGSRSITHEANLIGLDNKVWYDPDSVANIFGLYDLTKQHRVTYDSAKEDSFLVHVDKDDIIKFKNNNEGLYYFTPPKAYIDNVCKITGVGKDNNNNLDEQQFVSTVAENRSNYSTQQYERAKVARKLYHNIGTPTVENFKYIIKSNTIKNCPVTIKDIEVAEDIWGKDISYIKGKTTRSCPNPVKDDFINIPLELKSKHYELTLCIDTMYINGIGFLTSIAHPIYYRKATPVPDGTSESYYKALDKAIRVLNSGGYRINIIECDGEYKSLMDKVADAMDVTMNYIDKDNYNSNKYNTRFKMNFSNPGDHVPHAERNNRTIKESFRTALHRTGYKTIPKVMIEELGELCTERLNMFPAKHGISSYYSPEALVSGKILDYNKHCKYSFGEYVQASVERTIKNDMVERTIDAIYLRSTDNQQGGHIVMNLNTGRKVTSPKVIPIPLTQVVKDTLEALACEQGINSIKFTNKKGI